MRSMRLETTGRPLELFQQDDPVPLPGEIRLRMEACGVCRTDLHVVDGELPDLHLPIVPGHEVVGMVECLGPGVERLVPGQHLRAPRS